ncbi:right-handed parallel beta-helix repeat-containing protein [Chryseobacterium koreense]|uniref:Right handed beta helix domain-containing protein n=1 Tax=Chryseobacterium koreense CCUG 49689 TaxID=1304281 RepID=A0A0J7IWP2_9FLAO|nr:right-handed parallel beta-helix repeat-containing protein [Chryseobacterium koreense]KMQ70708.1 hypothetical protein ACM44_10320 [Chryseobacterium koreense CCUG 49689]MBB5333593.1 hypothetical protein [Chryseobacterium koreense]
MKSFKLLVGVSFWFLLTAVACSRDDISFDAPSQLLRFSTDTVFCDTVYNQVRSETYAVKIYNNEDKDVMIPKISLESGAASMYRINVDGKAGTEFNNVALRKKDSLYIFVEIAPVANAPEAIAEDRVIFQSPAGTQHVTLFSVVQDAEFFIKTETNPNILADNTTWSNDKAKIIFGDLTLAEGKTLNIQSGTKVYFHKNSGLKILKNSTLNVNGSLGNEVTFRGDRNDTRYDTIPKNWNGISFEPNSTLTMNYAKVFGGTRGLEMTQTNATIDNTIIHTHQEYGIYAVNSTVVARNLVMNNCGEADFGIFKGGNIKILHSTLANYWSDGSLPALGIYATNAYQNGTTTEQGALTLTIGNSIIYGEKENSIQFKPTQGQPFTYTFQYCLVKQGTNPGYNLDANSIKNQDPKFQNYFTHKLNLRVKADSPAKGKGNGAVAASVPTDILGISRLVSPTVGAYQ